MKIVYSNHALKRMKQRGFTSLEIEFILKHPDYVKKVDEKREVVGHLKGRMIKIVFTLKDTYLNIITII